MFFFGLRRPRAGRLGAGISGWPASLLRGLLLAGHLHPPRALARARVGLGALAVDGHAATVAEPAVGPDLLQALDVLRALAAQVALDGDVAIDRLAQLDDLVVGEVTDVGVGVDPQLRKQLVGG